MQSALASSVEPALWKAPAAPLHHRCRAPGAVQSQRLKQKAWPFSMSLWDTHSLQLLEKIFCVLALKFCILPEFVFRCLALTLQQSL